MATFLAADPDLVLHLAAAAAARFLPQRRAAVSERPAGHLQKRHHPFYGAVAVPEIRTEVS